MKGAPLKRYAVVAGNYNDTLGRIQSDHDDLTEAIEAGMAGNDLHDWYEVYDWPTQKVVAGEGMQREEGTCLGR